jgi:alpha-ketoglutaric semialdehyde dehydrogenase
MTQKRETIRAANFIAGKWESKEDNEIRRLNPADLKELVATAPDSSAATTVRAIESATQGAHSWRRMTAPERGKIMLRAARIAETEQENLAQLITWEQGKVIAESRAEVTRAINIMEYASGMGRRLGGSTLPSEAAGVFAYTTRLPIGTVALISPWNFPIAIPCWKIAPAFVCGCPIVIKPSPFTPACATRMVEIFLEAGVPPEALSIVHGGPSVGEQLVTHPMISGISFTGSTKVGMGIHATAAKRMAKTQLEMGGKNPQIVLRDADIGRAVDGCIIGALDVSGQRCTCTSRVIVEDVVAEEFTERFVAKMQAIRVGPGHHADVDMGPLVDPTRLAQVAAFVERAKSDGANILAGGDGPSGLEGGCFYAPTVIDNITAESEIAREEVFGPVVGVIRVKDFAHALSVANSVEYGLSASIYTKDIARIFDFVDRVEAGMIHINRPTLGGYSHFPFGGVKNSSHGPREIGDDTIGFYTGLRSVYINYD